MIFNMKNVKLVLLVGLVCLVSIPTFAEQQEGESPTLEKRVSKMEKCLKDVRAPSKAGSPYTSKFQQVGKKKEMTCPPCAACK